MESFFKAEANMGKHEGECTAADYSVLENGSAQTPGSPQTDGVDEQVEITPREMMDRTQIGQSEAVDSTPGASSPDLPNSASGTEQDGETEEQKIARLVTRINETQEEASAASTKWIAIGNLILDAFFAGDLAATASKNPKKSVSFRKLTDDPRVLCPAGTLSRCVRVAAQERFFGEKHFDVSGLLNAHRDQLIKIENGNEKLDLVREVLRTSMSSRDLETRIKSIRAQTTPNTRTQRTMKSDRVRPHLDAIRASLNIDSLKLFFKDTEAIRKVPWGQKEEMQHAMRELSDEVQEIKVALDAAFTVSTPKKDGSDIAPKTKDDREPKDTAATAPTPKEDENDITLDEC